MQDLVVFDDIGKCDFATKADGFKLPATMYRDEYIRMDDYVKKGYSAELAIPNGNVQY